jgi:hypothetical protein
MWADEYESATGARATDHLIDASVVATLAQPLWRHERQSEEVVDAPSEAREDASRQFVDSLITCAVPQYDSQVLADNSSRAKTKEVLKNNEPLGDRLCESLRQATGEERTQLIEYDTDHSGLCGFSVISLFLQRHLEELMPRIAGWRELPYSASIAGSGSTGAWADSRPATIKTDTRTATALRGMGSSFFASLCRVVTRQVRFLGSSRRHAEMIRQR